MPYQVAIQLPKLIPKHVHNREFDYGAAMHIIEKDLELWRKEAQYFEAPMWLGATIRALFRYSISEIGRGGYITELALSLEKMAGAKIPKTRS